MQKPKNTAQAMPEDTLTALPLNECLAKTYGQKLPGRQVLDHCQIVGEMAKGLLARMPTWLVDELFPKGSELVAACHDIGKVSPTFQERIYRHTEGYRPNSKPGLESFIDPDLENHRETGWGGHAGVSQAAAKKLKAGKYIPEILGQHHGNPPRLQYGADAEMFGGEAWQQRREELVGELKRALNCTFPTVKNPDHARVLAGLTSVADWLGSSPLFDDPNPAIDWRPLIVHALNNAGFIRPQLKTNLTFADIFNFAPHESQQKLFANATQAGVYILEAPMGLGKTEAALYAAYQAMAQGKATGIYFALPTQLTSDKIHQRVNQFLDKILAADSLHQKALLVHGNAWLKQTELGVEGNPGGSWFEGRKRGILAPFAVGTVDQALMAVMNVKHGFVRTFGLAGKVVILDEVHTYDAYTGTILDELVRQLRGLHCTVIILSATLTQERRGKLLAQPVHTQSYPLISAIANNQAEAQEWAVTPLPAKRVGIYCCQADSLAIDEALKRAGQGQQVLWIENTVAEAQAVFMQLNAMDMPIGCGLLHSRFLKADRETNENHWVALYGKDNAPARQAKGHILVGSQVLEQSLDIDADFLISRFAPTDMLLQRIGRLWRHESSYRPAQAKREAWLLVPGLDAAAENAKQQFGKTAKVYSPYVLCRSLAVWRHRRGVNLPTDIRGLIEATYLEQGETGAMQQYKSELAKKRAELELLARSVLATAGQPLPETASTRYSEQDSVQVLLLRAYRYCADKKGTELTLLDNGKIFLPSVRDTSAEGRGCRRELAAKLLKNTLQVASHIAPQAVPTKALDWLKEFFYLGDAAYSDSLLRVAIVDDAGKLKSLSGGPALAGHQLDYDKDIGYRAEK